MFRPHLESETHAEGGDAEIKNRVVERRRLIVSDRNRAARKNNSRGSRLLHIVGRYARGVGDDGENAELAELLHDEVVELRTHRKEEDKMLGLPHPHFFGYLGKSFRVGSLEDGQHARILPRFDPKFKRRVALMSFPQYCSTLGCGG